MLEAASAAIVPLADIMNGFVQNCFVVCIVEYDIESRHNSTVSKDDPSVGCGLTTLAWGHNLTPRDIRFDVI